MGGKKISKAGVIEIVLDADYITTYNPKLSQPVKDALKNYKEYTALKAALAPYFFEEYV